MGTLLTVEISGVSTVDENGVPADQTKDAVAELLLPHVEQEVPRCGGI